ncbi:RluA family pseudouridine synthase [Capnocytophaga canimorsus]|uniref:RNA pseudouridine synthase n=1 Tax=Capnocytophaga canimorsus TaxID=28188 RepID=A0AAC9Z505_9FLAO|nr:RNA pseudouridine synthase [Capnocytophaga canimorsus]ATA94675.1 RNA pseudouridine synthase [Capnocytophaga canimorsus]AYW35941.1 RNA pseudouridine synthase [Capnocytophaga canimorsus]
MKIKSSTENLQVLYEDNHLIVINKRAGDIVQGDKTGDMPLSEIVKQYLKEKYHKSGEVFLGVVHRLDRPTTGIVVFAKTSKALSRLNMLFSEKESVTKTYWAMTDKVPMPTEGELQHWMIRNTEKNKSTAHKKEIKNSKRALLKYRLLLKMNNYHLIEIQLMTGRHHQIRAQLAAEGCTIKGDLKYGAKRSNSDGSIHLHARKLSFIHPVKKERIEIQAPIPNDVLWQSTYNQLNGEL